ARRTAHAGICTLAQGGSGEILNRVYAFLGTAIAVASDEPPVLDWLDEFLTPAFDSLPSQTPALFHVTIRSAGAACDAIHASRPPGPLAMKPCFALDQHVVAHPHWITAGRLVLDDVVFGAFYVLSPGAIEVVVQRQS